MVAFRPWQYLYHNPLPGIAPDLDDLIDITISDLSKADQVITHKRQIYQWVSIASASSRPTIDDRIIIYTDGSQSERGYNGAGLFLTNSSFSTQETMAWNLGQEYEVYDAELFAIYKALEIGNQRSYHDTLTFKDLWIFSDSQAALKGLKAGQTRANHTLYQKIYNMAETIGKKGINIHISWVPGYLGIYGNEKADQSAQYGANWVDPCSDSSELGLSISFLSRKLKERILSSWSQIWATTTHSQHYQQFKTQPKLKPSSTRLPKLIWSTIMQLKLAHGYFRSYLVRLPDYDDDICHHCHGYSRQTPYHLLFECCSQSEARKNSIQKLDHRDQHLYNLFMTTSGLERLIQFLQESKVATRQWIL
jgi:ribonuclease HI